MLDSGTQKKDQGFSLIEMMIVLAVLMILAAITVVLRKNSMGPQDRVFSRLPPS
jgi:prepilin-type N-terminal cleavage/methylation domain-containing protein